MKNLHKLLALVLALATVFSLTVGAYAAEVTEETETPETATTEETTEEEPATEENAEAPVEEETAAEEPTPEEPEEAPDAETEEPADPEEAPDETPAELPDETPAEEPTEEPAGPDEGVLAASDTASGTCGDNLTWALDSSGTLTISGAGSMEDYDNWGSYTPWYSNRSSITAVVLQNGVTSIGDSAFEDCDSLTSVTIPDSVTSIGESAFAWCSSLTSVTIPDSVTSIGNYTFDHCTGLTSVIIGSGVTSIGYHAFEDCTSLTSVTIPDSVTSIGNDAFYACSSLTSVTIGNGVTSIGSWAFSGCTSLTSVKIGSGVTFIGASAFSGTPWLESVTIDGFVVVNGILLDYTGDATEVTIPDSVTSIGEDAFYGCDSLTSVTIPDSVTSIGESAFAWCSSLTSVTIPDSVTEIGDSAFWVCDSLTSVTIPDSVTKISWGAFYGCSSLTTVTIPDSVTKIDDYAFYGCSSLTSVTIGSGVTTIDKDAFSVCGSLTAITVSKENTAFASVDGVLYNKNKTKLVLCPSGKTSVTIPDSVTEIGDSAFTRCTSLTSVTIPDSVTKIGDYAFFDCDSLTSVTIPDSVTSIGRMAFDDCDNLASVTLGSGVTSIGDSAFAWCYSLERLTVGNKVETIGDSAFSGCESLTEVVLPASLKRIDSWAFEGCEGLTSVKIGGGVIGEGAFSGCCALTSVTLSEGVTALEEGAFVSGSEFTEITVPASVTRIGAYALGYYGEYSGEVGVAYEKTPTFTITGYSGSAAETYAKENGFTFKKLNSGKTDLSACTVTLSKTTMTYTGKALKPAVTVKDGKTTLTSGTDYTVNYSNNTNIGTATVKITGKGNYTGTVTKTFKIALGTPTLSTIANVNGGLRITWKSVSGASKYAIYRRAWGESKEKKLTEITGTSYADATVKAGTTYYYTVRARKGATMSAASNTLNRRYLSVPTIVELANENDGIRLKWNKTPGCSGYNIYRRAYGTKTYTKLAVVKGADNRNYLDKSVTSGKTYVYRIYAYYTSYTSSYESNTLPRLIAPTLSSVTNPSSKSMKIKWTRSSWAEGYEVMYISGTTFRKSVTVIGGATTATTRSGLTKGRTFKVYVRSYKTVNGVKYYSAWSNSKSVTIQK